MARIERQRREHGADHRVEVVLEEGVHFRAVLVRLDEENIVCFELLLKSRPCRAEVGEHRFGDLANTLDLDLDTQTVNRELFDAGPQLAQQSCESHHVKFVEVVCCDGEKLDALEKRV